MTPRQRVRNWNCLHHAGSCSTSAGWRRKKIPVCFSEPLPSWTGTPPEIFISSSLATDQSVAISPSCKRAAQMSPGCGIAPTQLILPAIIARPICLYIRGRRKLLALSRWKVRPAGLRWLAFAAATWIGLFCTIRNRGQRRRLPNPWLAPSKPPARATCDDWGRAPRGWLRNAFPGPGGSNVYFTFIAKFALTIGNNVEWTTRRSTQFAVIERLIALLSVNFAATRAFLAIRLIRYFKIANCSPIF